MKTLILLFITAVLACGCASSEKNDNRGEEYPNLVSLNAPGDQKKEESNIYIDTVKSITQNQKKALLISGSFPDGCTHLKTATHAMIEDTLRITLEAWREPDKMCAQVLTPFSYIYQNIPEKTLKNSSSIMINERSYQIN